MALVVEKPVVENAFNTEFLMMSLNPMVEFLSADCGSCHVVFRKGLSAQAAGVQRLQNIMGQQFVIFHFQNMTV